MNLSPQWVGVLGNHGIKAIHWSNIGDPRASDEEILNYARDNEYVVFTHDLDFGALLALTHSSGPSVIQARTQNVDPEHLSDMIIKVLLEFKAQIEAGALIILDEGKLRVRILPLG